MAAKPATLALDGSLPPSDCFSSDLIQIDVGPEDTRRIFRVHEGVLCHYSGYFKGALRGDFIEAKTKHIQLATEDPDIFTIFVYWLYTRRMPPSIPATMDANSDFLPICQLWVFADARSIPRLQNEAMDALIKAANDSATVPTALIPYVYGNTLASSPLRRVLIDSVSKAASRTVLRNTSIWTKEALIDLAGVLWANHPVYGDHLGPKKLRSSDYYVIDGDK